MALLGYLHKWQDHHQHLPPSTDQTEKPNTAQWSGGSAVVTAAKETAGGLAMFGFNGHPRLRRCHVDKTSVELETGISGQEEHNLVELSSLEETRSAPPEFVCGLCTQQQGLTAGRSVFCPKLCQGVHLPGWKRTHTCFASLRPDSVPSLCSWGGFDDKIRICTAWLVGRDIPCIPLSLTR